MNAVATRDSSAIIESVIVKGDLSKLTLAERSQYYVEVCKSVGLNPLTKPFEYITLNGKLTLYALRGCTDQLRSIHKVSVVELTETERDGVFIVTAKVQNGEGRTDMAKGAVTLGTLKGDALANALMKAETKAKRRATLSICGLGFLDETEIETIPPSAVKRTRAEIQDNAARKRQEMNERIPTELAQITSLAELERYKREVLTPEFMSSLGSGQYGVEEIVARRQEELEAEDGALDIDPETGEIVEEGPPATRADYIKACHDRIAEAMDAGELLAWWNHKETKAERKRFSLTNDEIKDLMDRVVEKRAELEPMAAG
jgi:hypothetical protein